MSEARATAEGELSRTPVAHLLVYALDRQLTGALFFTPPDNEGGETIVRLHRGVPVKIKPGDNFALLGQMLLEAKAIDAATLDAALATKGLLGDVLLLTERIRRDVLEQIAREQFIRRMVRLFALPAATLYRYQEGHDALEEYGGDPATVDPLEILWAGLRLHGDVSTLMEATLARLGDGPLRLHAAATVPRFGLDPSETPLLDALTAARPLTAAELRAKSFPGLVRRFLYALAITRQLEAGAGPAPLGSETAPSSSQRSAPAPPPGNTASLAKVALRSTVHRVGAAAPDAPGAGERLPPPPGRRWRTTGEYEPTSSIESSGERRSVPDSGVVAITDSPQARPAEGPQVTTEPACSIEDHPLASLSSEELQWLAVDYLEQSDVYAAVEACDLGCARAPSDPGLLALRAWARAHVEGADLTALAVELDTVVAEHADDADAYFYRAMLLRRLGDDAGSARDLRRASALDPTHEGVQRALASLGVNDPPSMERSVLGRFSGG